MKFETNYITIFPEKEIKLVVLIRILEWSWLVNFTKRLVIQDERKTEY